MKDEFNPLEHEENLLRHRLTKQREAAVDEADLLDVMRQASGRSVMWSILEGSGLNMTSFVGEKPLTSAHEAGKREIGLMLWDRIRKMDIDLLRLMEDEAIARAQARKGSV